MDILLLLEYIVILGIESSAFCDLRKSRFDPVFEPDNSNKTLAEVYLC